LEQEHSPHSKPQSWNSANSGPPAIWNSGKEKRRNYVVNVFWSCDEKGEAPVALANEVAAQILAHDPQVKNRAQLQIVMFCGYDIGIAHAMVREQFVDSPADWEAKISASQ